MYNRAFNDSSYEQFLNEGKIMAGKCKKCGAISLPPRPLCISCFSSEMEWVQLKGEGSLAAFTDIFVAPPYMAKDDLIESWDELGRYAGTEVMIFVLTD